MVSKKKRRKQLARAAAERQSARRAERNAKAHRRQRIAMTALAVVLLAALAYWIATHRRSDETVPASGDALSSVVSHYAGFSYQPSHRFRGAST
ncbi:MAG: hypothetical protein QM655_00730 [Nocardioidaceae bacterium]